MTEESKLGGMSQQRMFQLHDSETICKLFLKTCRRYDLGQISEGEFVQSCMRLNDEAENFGLTSPVTP